MKAVVDALTTMNASSPGTKLTRIAASGVCPLFVLPIVLRTLVKSLFRAREKSVRLDTYRAELLRISSASVESVILFGVQTPQ